MEYMILKQIFLLFYLLWCFQIMIYIRQVEDVDEETVNGRISVKKLEWKFREGIKFVWK